MTSVDELSDADFVSPTRNVQLPEIPDKVASALGVDKPIIIKKNIFERNAKFHSEVSPEQSRDILKAALYNPQIYGQNKPTSRPYNWVVINVKEDGKNKLVLLEIDRNKDNAEIVHWHYLDEKGLKKIKRQAENEDGRLLILPSDSSEEVGALSNPESGSLSTNKGNENNEPANERKEKTSSDVDLNGQLYSIADLEQQFRDDIEMLFNDNGIDAEIVGVKLIGSRMEGSPRVDSDLDLLVEYKGDYSEDSLFNILNQEPFEINGVKLDINPITEGKSGTIEQFVSRNAGYVKDNELASALQAAREQVDTEPTEAQKKAGKVSSEETNTPNRDERFENIMNAVRRWEKKFGVKISTYETLESLPAHARRHVENGAVVHAWTEADGSVHLFLPGVGTESAAVAKLIHELVMHSAFGSASEDVRNAVYDAVFAKMTPEERGRFRAYVKAEMDTSGMTEDEVDRLAADEFMAQYAERFTQEEVEKEAQRILDGDTREKGAFRSFIDGVLNFFGINRADVDDAYYAEVFRAAATGMAELMKGARSENVRRQGGESVTGEFAEGASVLVGRDAKNDKASILDVGEKIEGARKDMVFNYARKGDANGTKLSEIFPKPNFGSMRKAGVSLDILSSVKAMYMLSKAFAKNKRIFRNKLDVVRMLGSAARYALSKDAGLDADPLAQSVYERVTEIVKNGGYIEAVRRVVEELGADYLDVDFTDIPVPQMANFVEDSLGYYVSPDGKKYVRTSLGTGNKFYYNEGSRSLFDTMDDAWKYYVDNVRKSHQAADAKPKHKMGVYYTPGVKNSFYIAVKINKDVIRLKGGFESSSDAFKYINDYNTELNAEIDRIAEERRKDSVACSSATGKARRNVRCT